MDLKANSEDVFKVFDEVKRSVDLLNSKIVSMEQSKSFADILNEQKLKNMALNNTQGSLLNELGLTHGATMLKGTNYQPMSVSSTIFVWFGEYTRGQGSLQTYKDTRTGKYSFKESAMDKDSAICIVNQAHSTGNTRGALSNTQPLSSTSRSTQLGQTAVPVATSKPAREEFLLKWSSPDQPASCEPSICHLCPESGSDNSLVQVTQAGLYQIHLLVFLDSENHQKPPVLQVFIEDAPLLSTISDRSSMVVHHS